MLAFFLLGEPPVLPYDSVEALWETWQSGQVVWVDTARAEDLLPFPLFTEADVRAILKARDEGSFRSFEDFFARTGLNPDLLPFLSPWLRLRPRDNLFLNVTASTTGPPRISLRRDSRKWSLWGEYRHADTSFRAVMATAWAHAGTFRPVTGWTGPFPRSLWSSLRMPDEASRLTRLDTVWRVWLHPALGRGTFHVLWPDSILGFTWGARIHFWYRTSTGEGWLGFRTPLLGVEAYPGSTLTWAVVGFLPGERLRWAWRWNGETREGEARVHLRFPTWGFRLRWLAGQETQVRGRAYVRLGQTRLYAGVWEHGGWIRVVRAPWSWKWGYAGAHRVEIRFWGRTGFFRAGVVSDTTHLWWLHTPWQVTSGYAEGGFRFHRERWSGDFRGLVSAGRPPRVGVGGTLRWRGFVSW